MNAILKHADTTPADVSRRSFLVGSGAVTLGLSFGPLATGLAQAQGTAFSPIAWVSIGVDNVTTIYSPASEMGQGTMTAIPMVVAEEMELDWSKVRVQHAPPDARRFGNPRFGGGLTTGASRTVQGYYGPLRLAGLQGKLVMLQAAARQWNVPIGELKAENSSVVHSASGRRVTYGELARTAQAPAELPKVDNAMLKPMAQFKIIGKDLPRVDLPAKSSGTAVYGIDVRLPGMLYATLMSAPVQGERALKVDDAAAKAVRGVRAVVVIPTGVAVVADSFYTARKARELLKVEWSTTAPGRAYHSQAALGEYVKRAENLSDAGVTFYTHGDAAKELAGAAKVVKATYVTDHVVQFTMEPQNTTARVDGDRLELWTPSQTVGFVVGPVSAVAGFKPENIKVNITLLGGGYGRRVEGEYAVDAAMIAKAVPGVPIQMIWTREDDFVRAKPRPATAQHLIAAVNAQGRITGLQHRVVAERIYARLLPGPFAASGNKDSPVMEFADGVYDIPGHLVQQHIENRGVACSFWRGVGAGYIKFATETLIDEVAAAHNQDPLQARLTLLNKSPRGQAVLREVASMSGWGKPLPAGQALGVAFSDAWNSFIGMVVQVSVSQGRPVVHNIWAAVDCGHALMPRNVATQIEGSALFGLSAALTERLNYVAGEPVEKNLGAYQLLRADAAPPVHVKVMPTDYYPGGIGEVGLPPVAPALANALARLTGKRIRTLPFPDTV
ncbi:MAG: Isoquinoline 1-oxidoreductase subunit beta [Pseudomonadota bacterium]|jgi:isoquinoline 1-oxidoreductase subunit beta